jgi:hypothetical protein
VRRDSEFIVHSRAYRSSQIMQGPMRDGLACFGYALIEKFLAVRPSLISGLALAENIVAPHAPL